MWYNYYKGQTYFKSNNNQPKALAYERENKQTVRDKQVEKNDLCSKSSGSGSEKIGSENSFIFTGYYETNEQPKINLYQLEKTNTPQKALKQIKESHNHQTSPKIPRLYPKPMPKSTQMDKKQMFQKFQTQKRIEYEFFQLQAHLRYTEEIVAHNPHLYSYYYSWMKHAQYVLKQYMNVIEAPDNLSFSSVFGYSKDEEVQTVYRHPVYEMELNKSRNLKKTNKNTNPIINKNVIDWKQIKTGSYLGSTNESDSFSKTSSKPSSTSSIPNLETKRKTSDGQHINRHNYYY